MDINRALAKTHSGGYDFKNATKGKKLNCLIANHLSTNTKFRGVGADIGSSGGYVVGPCCNIVGVGYVIVKSCACMMVLIISVVVYRWLCLLLVLCGCC